MKKGLLIVDVCSPRRAIECTAIECTFQDRLVHRLPTQVSKRGSSCPGHQLA